MVDSGPRIALLDARLRLRRSTPGFGQAHGADRITPDVFPELELVLGGHAGSGRVAIGQEMFAVEAVTTKSGSRHVLLTAASDDEPGGLRQAATDDPLRPLRASLEASPTIAWAKDLDGRYLYVNPRFLSELGTSEDRILGRTDIELDMRETVDGPRRAESHDERDEPRQLEYTVPAFEERGELAVLRFVLRDRKGQAHAVCGVAAPLGQAQLARDEAHRLMQLERWSRMGPAAVRAELLEEWGISQAPGDGPRPADVHSPAPNNAADWEHRAQEPAERLVSEAHRWLETARGELENARAELEATRAELERTRHEREQLERALQTERSHRDELLRAPDSWGR